MLGNLLLAIPAEVAHLDHLCELRIERFELEQRFVDPQQLVARTVICDLQGIVAAQRDMLGAAAMTLGLPLARRVDDDVAHRLRGIGEEVPPVFEPQAAVADELHEALVHQHRRVHRIGPALAVQPGAGDAPQVRIQRRVDRIERAAVALGRAAQQQRDRRQFGRGLKRHLEAIGFVATDRSVW